MIMPFDARPMREPPGDPWWQLCRSCEQPIAFGESAEKLMFADDQVHKLQRLNGIYHAACAKPILSLLRVLEVTSRLNC
jgi:hypothetical protein